MSSLTEMIVFSRSY